MSLAGKTTLAFTFSVTVLVLQAGIYMRQYGLTQCLFRRCDVSDDMNMGFFETKFTPKGIILRDRSHTESRVLIALCVIALCR